MNKIQQIVNARQRARIAQNPAHLDWYEGMDGDAADELARAEALPDEVSDELEGIRLAASRGATF